MTITRQEMFDRAVRGLRAQGWVRCGTWDQGFFSCRYHHEGLRCGWGHVDHSLDALQRLPLKALREMGVGLAAEIDHTDVAFAKCLQVVHDEEPLPAGMEEAYRGLGEAYELTWPEEP